MAGHLVAAGTLAEDDPESAWEHARAARSQGGRIAVVRETVGLVAYRAGHWAEAISELRAARRMTGGPGQLAVIADAERALGKPERAIELSRTPEASQLDPAAAAELQIVLAGARADLGQVDAAVAALHSAAREVDAAAPHAFRLYYAYAALLEQVGRHADALTWFVRAADGDADDESDAAERARVLGEDLAQASPGSPAQGPESGPVPVAEQSVGKQPAREQPAGERGSAQRSVGEQSAGEQGFAERSAVEQPSGELGRGR